MNDHNQPTNDADPSTLRPSATATETRPASTVRYPRWRSPPTLLGLHFATWGSLLDPTDDPPLWLMVLAAAMVAALSLIPGAVVGRVAGLRRGWRRTAAGVAALGGVVTASAVGWIVGAVPGLIGGSLLAVVLADRLGNGVTDVPPDGDRPGPMRSREDRVISAVCGGWARVHGWEPVRARALTVLAVVVTAVVVWPLALVALVL